MKITSVKSFIDELYLGADNQMFRGQGRDWPLLPSIGRNPEAVRYYEDWTVLHEEVIEQFLRLGRPHFSKYPETPEETWIIAQHHGVPTRLLDTTTNPLKALFFAVNNPLHDGDDGVVWAFEYSGWRRNLPDDKSEYWEKDCSPLEPAQYTPRLTAQEGAFICYPLPDNRNPLIEIDKMGNDILKCEKFIVPKESKVDLRRELNTLGCTSRLLFPDLDGVARGILLSYFEK